MIIEPCFQCMNTLSVRDETLFGIGINLYWTNDFKLYILIFSITLKVNVISIFQRKIIFHSRKTIWRASLIISRQLTTRLLRHEARQAFPMSTPLPQTHWDPPAPLHPPVANGASPLYCYVSIYLWADLPVFACILFANSTVGNYENRLEHVLFQLIMQFVCLMFVIMFAKQLKLIAFISCSVCMARSYLYIQI